MPMADGSRAIRRRIALLARTPVVWLAGALCSATYAGAGCVGPTSGVPVDSIKALARGVNLAGWLESGGAPPDATLLRTLRQAGITHVRLPVTAELVMRQFSPEAEVAAHLHDLDLALAELIGLDYRVSVDLHPGGEFSRLHKDDPASAMKALQDAWGSLARIIKRHPAKMVFAELLNEPDIAPPRWQAEAEALAAFVRQQLPTTTLIVGPTDWQRADSLPEFRPLGDLNVVYAIHFYDPMAFTHQGHWDPADPTSEIQGLPFPARADDPVVHRIRQQLVDAGKQRALHELDLAIAQSESVSPVAWQLAPAVAWQERYARPLIINEFGVLKARAPTDSRVRWLASVVDSAEANCWGWAHWELSQGFGLVDEKTGKPDAAVMRALLKPR
jgi:endoglucanase